MFNNLLKKALTIIPKQSFVYYKYVSFTVNDIGLRIATYDAGTTLQGSVQAIRQDMYEKLGLDWSKKYISIHCSADIRSVDSEQPFPDKIVWNGKEYLVVRVSNWFKQDGWNEVIAIEDNQDEGEEDEQENENVESTAISE